MTIDTFTFVKYDVAKTFDKTVYRTYLRNNERKVNVRGGKS